MSTLPIPARPFVIPTSDSAPLYLPRRSRKVAAELWADYPAPIPAQWQDIARAKGFEIHRRIRDKDHLVLTCATCDAQTAQKVYTLRTANPDCGGCQLGHIEKTARMAGLVFLGFHPTDRHSGIYRASCGHAIVRQFGFVERIARGEVGARCGICLVAREAAEAQRIGWERLSKDPKGNANYRLYRHHCGHEQRVARANMFWGQCDCAGCGESWTAKPSYIYLIRIEHSGREVLKLGYSANPEKRFRHQLGLPKSAMLEPLRLVAMATGHAACEVENAAHAELIRRFPKMIVPHQEYAAFLNVVSEIYRPAMLSELLKIMDRIDRDYGTAPVRS